MELTTPFRSPGAAYVDLLKVAKVFIQSLVFRRAQGQVPAVGRDSPFVLPAAGHADPVQLFAAGTAV